MNIKQLVLLFLAVTIYAGNVTVGEKLENITVRNGLLVSNYKIVNNKMVYRKGSKISYKTWNSSSTSGRVTVIYHLAARLGVDNINKKFTDALVSANLPGKLPNSPYKFTTILDTKDAVFGSKPMASGRLEKSLKKFGHVIYVNDRFGFAQKRWNLKKKNSAVIILDKSGKVIFFKDGKLNENEIIKAVKLIKVNLN